jgi:hypothetical protein
MWEKLSLKHRVAGATSLGGRRICKLAQILHLPSDLQLFSVVKRISRLGRKGWRQGLRERVMPVIFNSPQTSAVQFWFAVEKSLIEREFRGCGIQIGLV